MPTPSLKLDDQMATTRLEYIASVVDGKVNVTVNRAAAAAASEICRPMKTLLQVRY